MKRSISKSKIVSFALSFALLLSSAQALITGLGGNSSAAMAETAAESRAGSYENEELFLPMYDTQVITRNNLGKPDVETFGKHEASYYPSYINQISDFDEAKKTEILAENNEMLENTKEWFKAGTLRNNLKKHVSADGQFSNAKGNYDDAPRIEKEITVNSKMESRKYSLGVFAPAGEVLTVTIAENLKGKVTVNIGYPYNGECDISKGYFGRWKNDRMAKFFLEFPLTETVTEIGSPLGGMVTINGINGQGNFKITVSGGVDMPDYKLGVSTKEDWKNILAAPGPYVWLLTPLQYFVMPKVEIMDIKDPYNALLWWHKASMISMYAMGREDTSFLTPVISVFDSFVYIGEGVAKVWAYVTNAPKYWCHSILDYNGLMYSAGAWGTIHEFNHHYQSHGYYDTEWGVGYHDEITNNVLSAISYILLTDIATTRSESNVLNGWNAVSDPYCNYKKLANTSSSKSTYEAFDTNKLFGFVDMMHTFGADKFIEFLRAMYGYEKEVKGYDGGTLLQGGTRYLTTEDGFALFASMYYKVDFVDYFTNVWHFKISKDVVNKIKKYKFEPYFSVNNLYSAGIKGLETGRAYRINVGTATVFKFDEYTLASTDNCTLKSVSAPQNGKLTKLGDGTYSYTPDANFTQDSFDLVYEVKIGGKTYTRTLVVKLAANYNYIETVTYNADSAKRGLSVQEAVTQFANENNVIASGTVNNFSSSTMTGDNLTHFKSTVVFPFTKNVTFMVYGDDKTLLKIGDKTAYTTAYIGNLDAAKNQEANKITLSVNEGEPLKIEAYCFNTGGNGSLQLKYSVDGGETYQDIPGGYCYGFNASTADIEASKKTELNVYSTYVDLENLYLNRWYATNSVRARASSVKLLDDNGDPVRIVEGHDVNALIDGTTSTWCHTFWNEKLGKITPFPHNIYISFAETASFNEIKFSFKNDPFGDYEIYTSEDGEEYRLLYAGTNTLQSSNASAFSVMLDTSVSTKYVKIVVKNQAAGKAFYCLSEIEFLQTLNMGTDYNVSSSSNALLEYGTGWNSVVGNYVKGAAMHADKGTVKFYLKGTEFMLFSTNAKSKIKIDGVTYTIEENRSNYAPSFIIDGLSDGVHYIEIEANDMTLDMIKTSGYVTNADGSLGIPAEKPAKPEYIPASEPKADPKKGGCAGDSSAGYAGLFVVAVLGAGITLVRSRKKSY